MDVFAFPCSSFRRCSLAPPHLCVGRYLAVIAFGSILIVVVPGHLFLPDLFSTVRFLTCSRWLSFCLALDGSVLACSPLECFPPLSLLLSCSPAPRPPHLAFFSSHSRNLSVLPCYGLGVSFSLWRHRLFSYHRREHMPEPEAKTRSLLAKRGDIQYRKSSYKRPARNVRERQTRLAGGIPLGFASVPLSLMRDRRHRAGAGDSVFIYYKFGF